MSRFDIDQLHCRFTNLNTRTEKEVQEDEITDVYPACDIALEVTDVDEKRLQRVAEALTGKSGYAAAKLLKDMAAVLDGGTSRIAEFESHRVEMIPDHDELFSEVVCATLADTRVNKFAIGHDTKGDVVISFRVQARADGAAMAPVVDLQDRDVIVSVVGPGSNDGDK